MSFRPAFGRVANKFENKIPFAVAQVSDHCWAIAPEPPGAPWVAEYGHFSG